MLMCDNIDLYLLFSLALIRNSKNKGGERTKKRSFYCNFLSTLLLMIAGFFICSEFVVTDYKQVSLITFLFSKGYVCFHLLLTMVSVNTNFRRKYIREETSYLCFSVKSTIHAFWVLKALFYCFHERVYKY